MSAKKEVPQDRVDALIDDYKNGATVNGLHFKYKCSRKTVIEIVREAGVLRTKAQNALLGNRTWVAKMDEQYFARLKAEEEGEGTDHVE